MLRPVVPFVLAGLSGVLAFAPVHIRQYQDTDAQGTRYAVVGSLERGWVFRVAPQARHTGQALFETARLVLNTPQELAAECHAYSYVGASDTLLERTSFMVHRLRSELPGDVLSTAQSRNGAPGWLAQLTGLCRSANGAEKTLAPVRMEGHRYVPAEAPQVAVLAVAAGAGWTAQVVRR
jgi:hypothetical protein